MGLSFHAPVVPYHGGKRRLRARRRRKARDALVIQWRGLSLWVAKQLRDLGKLRRQTVEEAEAAGMLGLLRAAELFDPGRGKAFSTYATYWVRHFILSAEQAERVIHIPYYIDQPSPSHGTVTPERAAAGQQAKRVRALPALDRWHPVTECAYDRVEVDELEALAAARRRLTVRDQYLLRMRFDLELRLREVAGRLGLTKQAVKCRVARVLERLREAMGT